jgi:LysM repeat protein
LKSADAPALDMSPKSKFKFDRTTQSQVPADAAKQKMDWKTIYALNKATIGSNPNLIRPGMKLNMPDGSTYRVQPGDNLSKIAAKQSRVNEQAAMPPDQAARLAPYLQKGADGSQYYNLPTTNPGETGAAMGQTNISPAALAQIKSPQGQQGIIKQLLAMTEPKNAVPQTTTTATDVSGQYSGGLEELSTNQLARYKTAAAKDAKEADKAGDFKRGDKRFSGIVQATKKQFDNDAKQVDESRAARRALMAKIVNHR